MARELDRCALIERSIIKKYRKELWNPFIAAVKRYELVNEGDKIAVCISGGKDSMLLAKLMQQLHKCSIVPFDLCFIVMDPGYTKKNRKQIEDNAALLQIPIEIFETDIFSVANKAEKNPCYLCARMRRGHLYSKARELGCNKIALGHHFSDVIETTVMGMFYGSQLQAMPPKLRSTNYEGMELIRPLYCVHEDDIIAWRNYNSLTFLQCACRFTEGLSASASSISVSSAPASSAPTSSSSASSAPASSISVSSDGVAQSKRQEIKELIRTLKKTNPNIENSIFSSIHNVCLDTMVDYKSKGTLHTFNERFNSSSNTSDTN